jgi:hypothetical protein
MADTKISALPASTTPLAGTEVLPIVQGGSTVKVSVANLTAGRAISATAVTASTGNFIVGTSGQGIDFSATPGTGTSELLADYEEGTWTPTYVPQTNSFTSITYDGETGGKYVKIGNVVHIQAVIVTDAITVGTATGGIRIGGLPFNVSANTGVTANGWSSLAIGAAIDWAGERPSSCIARQNTSLLTLNYRTAADGNTLTSVVADLDTGADKNILYVAGTYVTA